MPKDTTSTVASRPFLYANLVLENKKKRDGDHFKILLNSKLLDVDMPKNVQRVKSICLGEIGI